MWGSAYGLAPPRSAWQHGYAQRHSMSWGCAALRPLERHRQDGASRWRHVDGRSVSAAAATAPPAPMANGQKQQKGGKKRKPQEDGAKVDVLERSAICK